jgi:predicted O-methyltransferase YrrM
MTTPPFDRPSFDTVLRRLDGVEGWLTEAQARALYGLAERCPAGGRIVEIGSFRGRSTIVLASAADPTIAVLAIDPHAGNDRGPQELDGYEAEAEDDHSVFLANLSAAGVESRVRHVREMSHDALGQVPGSVDVLYIDGAHRYGPASDDIRAWGRKVDDGGALAIHDAFSSVGVTLAIGRSLVFGRRFRYLGRVGSLALYRRTRLTGRQRAANVLRQLNETPWFLRNLVVKALLVAHLGRSAQLLGHDGETWPY